MDLDGFLKLNDAQRANATAQAAMAATLADAYSRQVAAVASADSTEADIPLKLATADLTEEKANQQRLNNLSLFLNIQWDVRAHEHLIRARNIALQQERERRREGERMQSALREVSRLMAGEGAWDAIRDGWLGFEFVRGHVPFDVATKTPPAKPDEAAYEPTAWLHPMHGVPAAPTRRDPGSLLQWARSNTLYPVLGGPAWNFLASILNGLSESAKAEANAIQLRIEQAHKDALALEQQDWDRLKRQPQEARP